MLHRRRVEDGARAASSNGSPATATGRPSAGGHLCLSAVALDVLYPLPPRGDVIVGRDLEVTLSLDAPSLSRQHALFRLGTHLTVEDLGSKNGTCVRGQWLARGERRVLQVGEGVLLGEVALAVLSRERRGAASHDLWDADLFDAFVRHECRRALRAGHSFATLRLRRTGDPVENDLQGLLRQVLGPARPLASVGKDSYLVFVPASEAPEGVLETLKQAAARHGVSLRHEITRYPRAEEEGDRLGRVTAALESCAGNQSRAARLLGVSRQTLLRWIAHYGLPRFRDPARLRPPAPAARGAEADRGAVEDALARCRGNQVRAAELLRISRSALIRKLDRYGLRRPRG